MFKLFTEKLKKAWAETAPPSSSAPAVKPNPFAEIVGRLNLRNAGVLRRNLFRMLYRRQRCVALDCSQVRFMDGSALAVLLEFATACKDSGVNLRLLDPSPQMCNAFSMYCMQDVLVSLSDFNELENGRPADRAGRRLRRQYPPAGAGPGGRGNPSQHPHRGPALPRRRLECGMGASAHVVTGEGTRATIYSHWPVAIRYRTQAA